MTNKKISTELQEKIREAKRLDPSLSSRKLGERFGVHNTTVLKTLGEKSPENGQILTEQSEVSGNDWTISLPKTRIHTLEELLEYCKVDLLVWEAERFVCNKYEMGAKNEKGDLVVEPLFQVKAFLKKKVHVANAIKEIEALKEKAKNYSPEPPPVLKPKTSSYMLELALVDHHFGKLGWQPETGSKSYDIKVAEKIYWEAFNTLIDRTKTFTFDEIVMVIGNDLFQSDTAEGTTTKGTPVSTDGRYHKVFTLVRDTMIKSIEALRPLARKIKVVMVSGNHDSLSVFSLGSSLEMFFFRYDDVEIDNSPRMRKYYQYGSNMLLWTHGHKTKLSNLPILMATEQPKMFGATKYREAHTGHKHTSQSELIILKDGDENHGVRVRILPALCGVDDYHADHGFVGNLRSSEAFVWEKSSGIVTIAMYTDPD